MSALFAALGVYLLLPFETRIPGLATFTVLELAATAVTVAGLLRLRDRAFRSRVSGLLRSAWPLLPLPVWLVAAAPFHEVRPALDLKLALGFGAAGVTGLLVAAALGEPTIRRRAVGALLWMGPIAAAMAIVEPLTIPDWDGFWRYFRPYVGLWNETLQREIPLGDLHWYEGGLFRAAGILGDPNHLGAFLMLWFPVAAATLASATSRALWLALPVCGWALASTLTRSLILATAAGGLLMVAWVLAADVKSRRAIRRQSWISGVLAAVAAGWLATGTLSPDRLAIAGLLGAAALAVPVIRAGGAKPLLPFLAAPALILAALPLVTRAGPPGVADRMGQGGVAATAWRRPLWRWTFDEIASSPVTGPGQTGFYVRLHESSLYPPPSVADAHNLYLSVAVSGGLPAVVFLFLALGGLLRRAGSLDSPWARGLTWYWMSFSAAALVGTWILPVNEALPFWIAAALTFAHATSRSR